MGLSAIITIIIFIVAAIIIFKIVKTILKTIFIILILSLLLTAIFGFFSYKDVIDLTENFESKSKLMFLGDDGKLITGFSMKGFEEEPEVLTINQITEYQNNFKKQDYKKMLGDNYKMFIFDMKAFDFNDDELDFVGKKVSKNVLYSVLESNDPIALYKSKTNIDPAAYDIIDPAKFKSQAFAVLLSEEIEKKGQLFIFSEYKKKNIMVYPETALFKFIKLMPTSFIQNIFEKAKNSTINKINQTIRGD